MISSRIDSVSRNALWREHLQKEQKYREIRKEVTMDVRRCKTKGVEMERMMYYCNLLYHLIFTIILLFVFFLHFLVYVIPDKPNAMNPNRLTTYGQLFASTQNPFHKSRAEAQTPYLQHNDTSILPTSHSSFSPSQSMRTSLPPVSSLRNFSASLHTHPTYIYSTTTRSLHRAPTYQPHISQFNMTPQERFSIPVTSAMEIGWIHQPLYQVSKKYYNDDMT